VVLMELYPSIDDPEKYTRIIEPWFLNTLNKMSDSNTWMKIDVFDKASKVHQVGFKGNKEELEKYLENKDSKDYSDLIDMIVNSILAQN
jgi:hypothetical protein